MPVAGDGIIGHPYRRCRAIQSDRVVNHFVVAGSGEFDDQMVPLAYDYLARNLGINPALSGIIPNSPQLVPFHAAFGAEHHGPLIYV